MGKRTNTATWNEKYNRWQINVQKDGYRRSFYSSAPGRTGQREANAKADAWLDDGISPTGERLEAAYNQYRQECKENMSTTEYNHVDSVGRVWIIPNLGKRKITELNDGDVQKMLDKAAAMGRSKKTIQDINGILNKFLKWCRRNKKTTYRPDDVHIPASARLKGKTVLQPDDLCTLFSTDTALYKGKRQKDEYIHAYRFQVLTGLRPGELRGLRVKDIQGGVVYVQRSVTSTAKRRRGRTRTPCGRSSCPISRAVSSRCSFRNTRAKAAMCSRFRRPRRIGSAGRSIARRTAWQKPRPTSSGTRSFPS